MPEADVGWRSLGEWTYGQVRRMVPEKGGLIRQAAAKTKRQTSPVSGGERFGKQDRQ